MLSFFGTGATEEPTAREVCVTREVLVVTVDGPAGSGKTVCGRRAAAALGVNFISSGAYYRAVTYAACAWALRIEELREVLKRGRTLSQTRSSS